MAPLPLLLFPILFFVLLAASAPSSFSKLNSTVTLHLRPLAAHVPPISDQLASLAASSLARVHHLKRPAKVNSSTTATSLAVKLPLSPHSYGGYTVELSIGTPPQTLTFIMDTGSSLVWSPCTSRYKCSRCTFPKVDPAKIPAFIPRVSSSSKLIGCRNPKCGWIFGPDVSSQCQGCGPGSKNCSQAQACPVYIIQYGSGSTGGLLLSETLTLPGQKVPNFLVGCSVFSSAQPAGIAGFGRGRESLPVQLGASKFSYCLLSRKFDDTTASSNLVLETGSEPKSRGVSYTPFRKNPGLGGSAAFSEYYYVGLRKIIVGGKSVKIPYRYLVPGSDGAGGTIVDSGTTFTFMERPVFEAVAKEFGRQMRNYSRAKVAETQSGLGLCYDMSGKSSIGVPELVFHFKGGAKMALPLENYFVLVKSRVMCLAIITDNVVGPEVSGGPAIVLGSFQQQNHHVEYDLANDRFGFRRQSCK
ncbi:probable aspartyl protease At4g16563 [Punica granatum]|uniref:Uncharacterized protein n=2 Tax=Punica granatum TaxID=22663 RepID=A0A2I0IXV6_PUNGR|nr:probable aspartyl protease At4g16563 [Punica granatum]PKI48256.1 hypothetical protein CRG98_031358 [Punica granatum]